MVRLISNRPHGYTTHTNTYINIDKAHPRYEGLSLLLPPLLPVCVSVPDGPSLPLWCGVVSGDGEASLSEFQSLLDTFVPGTLIKGPPHWLSAFNLHRRLVDTYGPLQLRALSLCGYVLCFVCLILCDGLCASCVVCVCVRYGEGGVWLCGDAAHIHSPAGGQGLNLGLQVRRDTRHT